MIKITLKDRKEYALRLDFNAICSFEQATDKNFMEFADNLRKKGPLAMQISDIRALLWAGLLHQNKDLGLEEVGSLIEWDKIGDIATAIADAIADAFPKAKEETDKKKVEVDG